VIRFHSSGISFYLNFTPWLAATDTAQWSHSLAGLRTRTNGSRSSEPSMASSAMGHMDTSPQEIVHIHQFGNFYLHISSGQWYRPRLDRSGAPPLQVPSRNSVTFDTLTSLPLRIYSICHWLSVKQCRNTGGVTMQYLYILPTMHVNRDPTHRTLRQTLNFF